jgi:hypothetical protein
LTSERSFTYKIDIIPPHLSLDGRGGERVNMEIKIHLSLSAKG